MCKIVCFVQQQVDKMVYLKNRKSRLWSSSSWDKLLSLKIGNCVFGATVDNT